MSTSFRHLSPGCSPSSLTIATFNVRGLTDTTKRAQLAADMASRGIALCCLQETKRPEGFDEMHNKYRLLCLPSTSRHYGLGFVIAPWLQDRIIRYWSVSDRIAVIQISLTGKSIMTLVNVYGPHTGIVSSNAEEQDKFFSDLADVTSSYRSSALFYIAGDFNAKLGTRQDNETFMGRHTRGRRNINGTALAHFLDAHGLFACNTSFTHPARHQTTWQGVRRDTVTDQLVKIYNVIDYIVCRHPQKSLLQDSRSYFGTTLESDHRLVVAQINTSRLFRCWGRKMASSRTIRYATDSFADPNKRTCYRTEVQQRLADTQPSVTSAQESWNTLSKVILSSAAATVGEVPKKTRPRETFCPEMEQMSQNQRDLRMRIETTPPGETQQELKRKRNNILHTMRRRALANASARLDRHAAEVERLHDGAQMFRAVRLLYRKPYTPPVVHDKFGRTVNDASEIGKIITDHFGDQFRGDVVNGVSPFEGEPCPMPVPVHPEEVEASMKKLNNGRACGYDSMPAEMLQYAADVVAQPIADIFNQSLEEHQPLSIGRGVLILLQKPGKKQGPLSSLRPIVLLTTLRKTLSLLVLNRIYKKVDGFLGPGQSGFRRGRGTADVIFGYRWMCSKTQRCKQSAEILGLDMSRAFDTIRRDRLMEVLETFLDESELRIIRFLLAETSLEPRLQRGTCDPFATTIGTPQGDSLSPVLFVVYLEAALRDLRRKLQTRNIRYSGLPLDVAYADDVDFVSYSREFLDTVEQTAPGSLNEWFLKVNPTKTEHTSVIRQPGREGEDWRMTKKLGSLLGDGEDVARRKQLANVAFHQMTALWLRRHHISEELRLRLYNAFVVPVLLYNMGTWGLTKKQTDELDSFHRKQLRQVIGIRWPHRISNKALYKRCKCGPLNIRITEARWRLFGHVLRLPRDVPAQMFIDEYYSREAGVDSWRGRPRTSLPAVLDEDLKTVGERIHNKADVERLRLLTKEEWKKLKRTVVETAKAKLA